MSPATAIREYREENDVSTARAMAILCQRVLILLVLVLTASCTESGGHWENQDRPAEDWAKDEAKCRRAASDKAEQEYALDQKRAPRGYNRTRTYSASMNRFEAEKREKALLERCMTRNGYVRAERKTKPE